MLNIKIDLEKDFEIVIGSHKIAIKFVDAADKNLNPDDEKNYGLYNNRTILIDKDIPETLKFSTFLHESIHAIEDVFSFKMNHSQVNIISEMMAQFLSDQKIKKG